MKSKKNQGFTLIEVLVSLIIFVLVMGVFVSIVSVGLDVSERSEKITQEHNQAAQILEAGGGTTSLSTISIDFPVSGEQIIVPGYEHTYSIGDTKYKYFEPDM